MNRMTDRLLKRTWTLKISSTTQGACIRIWVGLYLMKRVIRIGGGKAAVVTGLENHRLRQRMVTNMKTGRTLALDQATYQVRM